MRRALVFLLCPLFLAIIQPAISSAEGTAPWLHVEGLSLKDPHGNVGRLKGVSLADPEVIARYWDFRLTDEDTPDAIGEVLGNAILSFHSAPTALWAADTYSAAQLSVVVASADGPS